MLKRVFVWGKLNSSSHEVPVFKVYNLMAVYHIYEDKLF